MTRLPMAAALESRGYIVDLNAHAGRLFIEPGQEYQ